MRMDTLHHLRQETLVNAGNFVVSIYNIYHFVPNKIKAPK